MSEPVYPLAGIAQPGRARLVDGRAGIILAERRPGSICEVALWPTTGRPTMAALAAKAGIDDLPQPGQVAVGEEIVVFALAPGRFQAIASQPGLTGQLEAVLPAEAGALVDLAQARGGVRLIGRDAEDLFRKGLDLDIDATVLPPPWAVQTAIHHMPVTVLRLDAETFEVYTFRAFAVSLWEWLTESAMEYGWRAAQPVD